MATTFPGASPLQNALSQLGALPPKDRAHLTKNAFDSLARETSVPANVLMALDEAAGGRGDTTRARENALRIGEALRGGGRMEDAINAITGDHAKGQSVIDRAVTIADTLYPTPTAPQEPAAAPSGPGIGTDMADAGKAIAAGAIRGAGSMVRATGVALDDALKGAIEQYGTREVGADRAAPVEGETFVRGLGRSAGAAVRGLGDDVASSISERGQKAMAGTQMEGELFSPSTWSLGSDPSLRGAILNTAQGVGSMAPMLMTRHPAVAAAMGGLMAGGEGAENARKFVLDAATVTDETGQPEIARMPEYQALVKTGKTHEQAAMELARRAESDAGFRQGLFGALGGAATNRIFRGAEGWIGAGGRLTRAVKKGGAGFLEEGTQEALEGAAALSGIEAATGADMNLAEDSFGNFVMGGLAGGVTGGAGGVMFGNRPADEQIGDDAGGDPVLALPPPDRSLPGPDALGALPPPDSPLALPAPTSGGAIIAEGRPGVAPGEVERDPRYPRPPRDEIIPGGPAEFRPGQNVGGDGSAAEAVAAPGMPGLSGVNTGAAATNPLGAAPPAGPIDALSRSMTLPEPEAPAPAPMFPEHKPGSAVRIGNPETGRITDGVFLGETDNGAMVRLNGIPVELSPEEFDTLRNAVPQIEAAQKEASELAKRETKANVEPIRADDPAQLPSDTSAVRMDDAGRTGSEGLAPRRPDLQAGTEGALALDGRGMPTPAGTGTGDLGGLDVADDAGQPENALTERPAKVDPATADIDQLRRRLDFLNQQGRTNGWNTAITKERKAIEALLTKDAPAVAIDAAAAAANPEPTEAQKDAGNYQKGHTRWNGLDLSIENARGSERRGRDPSGAEWSVTMPAHYGYFKGSEARDGDHVDFYMGPNPDSQHAYVIDQVDAETGAYDEAKVMLGYDSASAARADHEAAFSDGKGAARLGGIKKMSVPDLKAWLASDATKRPVSMKARQAATKSKPDQEAKAPEKTGEIANSTAETGDPIKNDSPTPQKRPFIAYLKANFRGINPNSDLAAELRARGITQKDVPGLFARNGNAAWDNIVASEHPEIAEAIPTVGDTLYLDPQAIAEAIAGEVAEKKRKAEAEDVDGFTDNMTPLQAGKVLGALTAKVNYNGRAVSRRDLIREKVNNGAVIEELDAEGEILMSPDETFLDRKAITKIGLDYAKHLIAARDSLDTNQPATSPTDPKAEAALKWLRDKAVHVPAQDETITVTDAMAEEDGIAPGEYRVRMFTFRGEIPSHMKTALRGVGDNHDFARSEFIRFGNQRSNQNTIEYTRMERDAVTPTSTPSQRTKGESAAKIEDFGEKLEGARKDTWAGYADRMKNAEDVDILAEPLSKSWPVPDYEKLIAEGIDPWTVAFIRVARDSIPTKPQKSWRLKGWAADVTTLRKFAGKLIDGIYTKEDILNAKAGAFRDRETIELYLAVGHGKSLKGLHLGAARYSVLNGVRHDPALVRWEVTAKGKATPFGNMPRVLAHGATKAEAIEAFKKVYDALDAAPAKAKKGPKLIIYSRDGRKTWHVGVKIGRNHIDLRSADTVAEARRLIAEEADAIIEQLDRMRDTPRERRDENQPRVGVDHRSGGDVGPEQFSEAFGFRGVQFGNWVEGDRRQQDLNRAYDALMDLAGILDIPPRALSLNGTLGLAFGARGSGGANAAAAHYEPGTVVINLTKKQGAGSLAHEWFHAADNYFARQRTDRKGAESYITDNYAPGSNVEGVRPEVVDAFIAVRHAIGKTGMKARGQNMDKLRSRPYWATGIEMHARAFESYVIAKLQDQNASNDYLANIVNGTAWAMKAELAGLGDSYPYLKEDEIDIVRPAFDALFETIQTRETDQGIELYQRDMSDRPVVAELTGDELGEWADIAQLGRKAQAWYRENLIGQTVTFTETGWPVKFARRGANKIGGRKGDELYRIIPALPAIIERGRLVSSEPNRKDDGIKAYHKVAARVLLDGAPKDVIVTLRESHDGKYHYDLSRDTGDGALFKLASSPVVEAGARPAMDGNPVPLNIDFAGPEINGVPAASLRDIGALVGKILDAHGLGAKISPRVVRGLLSSSGVPVLGSYRDGTMKVNAQAADPAHVVRHEIIHALRDARLWGTPHGLFTQGEWQALVRAARADTALRKAVETAYADQGATAQTEEMVAEMYADWARARDAAPPGLLGRALERMQSFFRAMASALRGEGFVDAAAVMRRIANGEIGDRGPDGPNGGRVTGSEERNMYQRTPVHLRPAEIGGDLASLSSHPDYAAAKAGDVEAAVRLARDIVTDDLAQRVRDMIGKSDPLVVPVVSEEASGRNKIPLAAAEVLAERLGLETTGSIGQRNAPRRTAMSGLDRIFASPVFDGDVVAGRDYLILDDTLTQGATFAALSSHIEAGGGRVVGALALTGKQYSAKLQPDPETLTALREKHGDLEQEFIAATGHGFDALTESEARYLTNFKPAERLRVRILDEGRRGGAREDQGTSQDVGREQRDLDRVAAQVREVLAGKTITTPIALTQSPPVLRALWGKNVPVVIAPRVIWKANADKHGLTGQKIIDALAGLSDPVMVFDSATSNDSIVALVEVEGETRPVVVAIHHNDRIGQLEISRVASIHAKDNPNAVSGWIRQGLLRYVNKKKADAWSWSRGLQLPKDAQAKHRLGKKILQHRDVFKDDGVKEQRDLSALKARLSRSKGRALGMIGKDGWKTTPALFSNWLSDAMGKDARWNVLGLVPGRALFAELGKNLPAAAEYLGLKERMDADRNDWQARSAKMVDKWTAAARRNPEANQALMELMHDSTLTGIDPTKEDGWKRLVDNEAARVTAKDRSERQEWAKKVRKEAAERRETHGDLVATYDRLPKPFKDLYAQIRDEYSAMADAMDAALMENIRSMSKILIKKADREHRKELDRIRDEGLTGKARAEALEKANEKKASAHARAARGEGAKLKQLRQLFEANRLEGPYFPLARFGNYFVTIRDAAGKVTSFSRFETARQQKEWMAQAEKDGLGKVESGVLGGDVDLREQVDPRFLADVEDLLADAGASKELMDQVWQRWLETLPDQSVRTNKIHRKGRKGYNKDAVRAFASSMFHGAHQMARLRYGAEMEEALETAEDQAKGAPDANRAGFVVREMKQRHQFTMQPTNNPWVTRATGAAFIWYLGMSPAAAAVNVSQTTIVGVPLMAARYKTGGVTGSIKELTKAAVDFAQGKGKVTKKVGGLSVMTDTWSIENAPGLTADERRAMEQGYQRGVIDKTQAHDLASVADSGVEYNPTREKVMRVIGFMFHHAERFNREVTYLASYRMARAEGLSHDAAISSAASMTWKIHFDYSNTSKPRAMTGDAAKVLTVFRNFQVNMLWRLFRDTHQALYGADKATKAEARAQLAGISLSMMAHAGVRGVWGYALITSLLALFFPGADDGDDIDAWLQDALLMEGDSLGTAAWNWTMGLALNGAPGHALGLNLTNRIGMPDLWFQSSGRDLEGQDLWNYYLEQIAGPAIGIAGSIVAGASQIGDGQVMRGIEKMVPTAARNVVKTARYGSEGVTTYYGDPLIEDVNPWQLLMQLQGFTPAEVAERYKINNRLRNKQNRIEDRRKDIVREIGDAVRAGEEIPQDALERMGQFNSEIPEWAITADTIRQSVRSRQRASQRNEMGVALNPKLNQRLRGDQPPALYGG